MLKLAIIIALAAVCYAQPTPPKMPDIPETFMTDITVHRREHGEENMGMGMWARDMMKGSAMEDAKFKFRNHTEEEERLELFDTHMAYFIFTNSTGSECRKHDIPDDLKMPMVWDWVKSDKAHGDRHEDPRTKKMYDRWTIHTERGLLMLYVDEANVNEPVALVRVERGEEEDVRFSNFKAMSPPATDFDVPKSCTM